jgi:type IV pilus assembly protein PilE
MTSRGFTLIELIIAVAIVAILASVALPSFQSQLRKSRRSDAEAFAVDVISKQQQFLVDRRAYASSLTDTPANGGLGLTLPASVTPYYTVTPTADNTTAPPTFALALAPIGAQAADTCGTLSIDNNGNRTASGSGTCW